MKYRSPQLDLLRIFACFLVVSFHWSGRGGFYPLLKHKYSVINFPHGILLFSKFGFVGVDIFFVLSGAVIANSSLGSNPGKFLRARFIRLFPVYVFAFGLGLLLIPAMASVGTRMQNAVSVTGLQFWFGGNNPIVTSWTLPFEINFYFLVWALLSFLAHRKMHLDLSRLHSFLNFWLLALAVSNIMQLGHFANILIPEFAAYFIYGASCALISSGMSLVKVLPTILISGVLSLKELNNRIINTEAFQYRWFLYLLFAIVIPIIIIRSNRHSGRKVGAARQTFNREAARLALMTYPIYLLHEAIGMSLISMLVQQGFRVRVAYLAVTIFILAISFLLVSYIEPFFRKKFFSLYPVLK